MNQKNEVNDKVLSIKINKNLIREINMNLKLLFSFWKLVYLDNYLDYIEVLKHVYNLNIEKRDLFFEKRG